MTRQSVPHKPKVPKYMEERSTEHDQLQGKMIPVYTSLHTAMKDAADTQGINLYDAYADACRLYLQNQSYFVPEIGKITPAEKTFVEDALHAYRIRNSNKMVADIIGVFEGMLRIALGKKI